MVKYNSKLNQQDMDEHILDLTMGVLFWGFSIKNIKTL